MKYIASVSGEQYEVEILDKNRISVNGEEFEVDFRSPGGQPVFSLLVGGRSFEAYVSPNDEAWQVLLYGDLYDVTVEDERERRLRATSGSQVAGSGVFQLKAPMPGLVVDIPVSEGQEIQKGEVLVILESMKMQNEQRSPKDGVVTGIVAKNGDNVEQKQLILSVE